MPNQTSSSNRSTSNKLISGVLLINSLLAIAIMITGVILVHIDHLPIANGPPPFAELLLGDMQLRPSAWLYSSIWLLIFTPVFGLVGAAIGALYDRDWRLLIVVCLLLIILAQGVLMFNSQ